VTMIDMSVWQGRVDEAEGAPGRRWHQVIQPLEPDTPPATTVLIGFACDAGVERNHGRVGAAEGPLAIRRGLRNMPVHGCALLADGGDVVCAGDALEAAQQDLADVIGRELAAGRFPLMLGGGSVAGYAVESARGEAAAMALDALAEPRAFAARYDVPAHTPPMLFAMGDGNHSLATAKVIWERHKAAVGMDHPSRFALVEVVNIHDIALDFAPRLDLTS